MSEHLRFEIHYCPVVVNDSVWTACEGWLADISIKGTASLTEVTCPNCLGGYAAYHLWLTGKHIQV